MKSDHPKHGPSDSARIERALQRSADLLWTENAAPEPSPPAGEEADVELVPLEEPKPEPAPFEVELVGPPPVLKVELVEPPPLKVELVEAPPPPEVELVAPPPKETPLDWLGDVEPKATPLDWLGDVEPSPATGKAPPKAEPPTPPPMPLDWLGDVE